MRVIIVVIWVATFRFDKLGGNCLIVSGDPPNITLYSHQNFQHTRHVVRVVTYRLYHRDSLSKSSRIYIVACFYLSSLAYLKKKKIITSFNSSDTRGIHRALLWVLGKLTRQSPDRKSRGSTGIEFKY